MSSIWYLRPEWKGFLNPNFIRVVTIYNIEPARLKEYSEIALMDVFNSIFPLGVYTIGGPTRIYFEEKICL